MASERKGAGGKADLPAILANYRWLILVDLAEGFIFSCLFFVGWEGWETSNVTRPFFFLKKRLCSSSLVIGIASSSSIYSVQFMSVDE